MAIGTTSTYSATRDQIIMDALTKVGGVGPNVTPSGDQTAHAARALGDLVKSLDAEGISLWKIVRRSFTLTAATAGYSLATDVMDLDEPLSYLAASGTSRSLIFPMSRDEYMSLTDRTVAGRPSRYYVERVIGGTGQEALTVYFWPVPDVTSDTIEYPAVLRRLDFNDGSTNSDFPTKWILCLKLGLASSLAFDYGNPGLGQGLNEMYQAEKAKQLGNDSERGNMVLVAFGGG